jgi:hypothetical protein
MFRVQLVYKKVILGAIGKLPYYNSDSTIEYACMYILRYSQIDRGRYLPFYTVNDNTN